MQAMVVGRRKMRVVLWWGDEPHSEVIVFTTPFATWGPVRMPYGVFGAA